MIHSDTSNSALNVSLNIMKTENIVKENKANPYYPMEATVKPGPYGLIAVTVNGQVVYFNANGTFSEDGSQLSTKSTKKLLGLYA